MENLGSAHAISPVDGRYASKTEELKPVFSEFALMKGRVIIEIEYLIRLVLFLGPKIVRPFTPDEIVTLRSFYANFSYPDFEKIKEFEKTANHDVKAVEYFLKFIFSGNSLEEYIRFIHLGKTSEDINNCSYGLMLSAGTQILIEEFANVTNKIEAIADANFDVPMLALTHGQPASPSTVEWTLAVYYERLKPLILELESFSLQLKWNGATGGDNALCATFPGLKWGKFSEDFIMHLQTIEFVKGINPSMMFEVNRVTNQIDPHDTYKILFEKITGLNTILIDFSQDIWMYIMLEYFLQKPKDGEIGSSAMPHKINPIDFENTEGNLGMANALFEFFSKKLPISRLSRDLSDSTVERNFGVAFSHTLIALKSLKKGLGKIMVNKPKLAEVLEQHWEVVSEAYQVILRVAGVEDGYELLLKEVRQNKVKITREFLHDFVDNLAVTHNLNLEVVKKLKSITPHNYVGNRVLKFVH